MSGVIGSEHKCSVILPKIEGFTCKVPTFTSTNPPSTQSKVEVIECTKMEVPGSWLSYMNGTAPPKKSIRKKAGTKEPAPKVESKKSSSRPLSEYNKFVQKYFSENKGASMVACAAAWQQSKIKTA